MANEPENNKEEKQEEPKQHHTWLGDLIDKIQDLDTDFPLSGGEEDPRPSHHHHTQPNPEPGAEEKEAPKEGEHHQSWFGNLIDKIQDLDTDFPLSGGEEDPRPSHKHTKHDTDENKE